MEEQLDLIVDVVAILTDKFANTNKGDKIIDNLTRVSIRYYQGLVEGGIPAEHAAAMCSNLMSSLGKSTGQNTG